MLQERKLDIWQLMGSAIEPSIRISKIKSASYISCIHRMRYGVDLCRKVQNKTVYPKITESFNELSVNTDTIDAENDAVTERCSVLDMTEQQR